MYRAGKRAFKKWVFTMKDMLKRYSLAWPPLRKWAKGQPCYTRRDKPIKIEASSSNGVIILKLEGPEVINLNVMKRTMNSNGDKDNKVGINTVKI